MFEIDRTESSKFTNWFYGLDRRLLVYLLGLTLVGIVSVVSAGSVQALRKGWDWYYFLWNMVPFYIVGWATLLTFSMLNKKWVLIISTANVATCMVLLLVTLVAPHVSHGSSRWVNLFGVTLMPSDIMKPGFVMITAWFLTQMKQKFGDNIFWNSETLRPSKICWWTYIIPFVFVLFILYKQPDIGTTMLYMVVLGSMVFIAGLPRKIWLPGIAVGIGVGILAFLFQPHVHRRFLEFSFFHSTDSQTQVGYSVNAIRQGGLFGMGDESFAKELLPDAHTDFIFAAFAEDWGAIVACLLIVFLLLIVKHLVKTAMSARDLFVYYAVGGATALFGAQVCVNLATTLGLMPPKGMTLPFISSGGSSFLGYCILFGMVLAIVREDKWK